MPVDKKILKIIEMLEACSWQKTAKFNYLNSKGIKSAKTVEVYDLDKVVGKFWGFDLKDNQLKQFFFVKIEDYIEVGEDFKPRYEKK